MGDPPGVVTGPDPGARAPAPAARAPELRPAHGSGLGVERARALRLRVDEDGAVRLCRPRRPEEVLTSAPRLQGAVWLPPEQAVRLLPIASRLLLRAPRPGRARALPALGGAVGGAVVLVGEDGPAVSWSVDAVSPWAGDAEERLVTSGSAAVVRRLGLVLEPAPSPLPTRAVRRTLLTRDRGADVLRWTASAALLVATVLAFLTWPFSGTGTGLVLGAGSLAAAAPVLATMVHLRRRFLHLVTHAPDPGGRAVFRPPHVTTRTDPTQLQLGGQDVVVVDGAGTEVWLPGPAAGGVTTLLVGVDDVHLTDADGRLLQALVAADVAPDAASRDRLARACAAAGIRYDHLPVPVATRNLPLRLRHEEWDTDELAPEERGDVSLLVGHLSWYGLVLLLPGALVAAWAAPPGGVVLLLGVLVWLGARGWLWWTLRRWGRDVTARSGGRRPAGQPGEEGEE